jgi:hypothetical protein
MKYTTNRSYKDSLMVEVDKVIKDLDKKQPTKKNWWVDLKKNLKKLF